MSGKLRIGSAWALTLTFLVLATPTTPALLVGAALAIVGLAVRAWAVGWLDKGAGLAVGGPYAHTRNPLYLGSFVIGMGFAVAGGSWVWPLLFAVLFALLYVPTMRREADELSERYGSRYLQYAASVPAFAVRPGAYRPEDDEGAASPPAARFLWSRYFRYREWEALLGVAAVLAVLTLKARS